MIRNAFLMLSLVGSTLLLTAGDASAQRRGMYRGGYYNNWGYTTPGYYSNGYNPYGYNSYYGNSQYTPYYSQSSSYYNPYYSNPNYYSTPNYNYSTPNYSTPNYATPGVTIVPQSSSGIASASYSTSDTSQNVAYLTVMLPSADAEIWLGNSATTQKGMQRTFQSPALEPGRDYTYTVKARWTSEGKSVEQSRDVNVRAGQTSNVDFRGSRAELIPPPDRNK
jgi:uncharacterized protein (TIGR03000 family)